MKFNIEVDCANCAAKMEEAARKVKGVKDLNVNFLTAKMLVEFDEEADKHEVVKEIYKVCKKIDSDFEIKE